MGKRFVGFGFGPIQIGLMLYEAAASGRFEDYVVSEVDQSLVDAVRANGNAVYLNIAGRNGIARERLAGIRLFNPAVPEDRREIGSAIGSSDELATAVPNVGLYDFGGEASIAALLAANLTPDKQRVIYTAENNNFAAELLGAGLKRLAGAERFEKLQILNTVIGKMSGVIAPAGEMRSLGLAPLVPGFDRCVLVEEFNRILVSRVTLPGFLRGIVAFEEKDDLLPFEEAKLFGHNAVHALLGYLARLRGYESMSRIRGDAELMELGRRAFVEESGEALIARHGRTGDPMFTEEGFRAYAEDLLERMTNPYLHDRVERIIREPERKLGYEDRFFGAMRAVLESGGKPTAMALGAAAAVSEALAKREGGVISRAGVRDYLLGLWRDESADEWRDGCLGLVEEAMPGLDHWRSG